MAIKVNLPDGNFKSEIPSRVYEALDSIKESQAGTHYLMVYPDLVTLRAIYLQYTKIQLEYNNEIVLILPYYETSDTVGLFYLEETVLTIIAILILLNIL